ncbi:3-deoxy-D-manno-octulosonic-acid transferase [Cnuella takakiae]|uniref:3-deoxy-D-manno-octulosonic acid transferase n=1 Tax=Cnuella takakiae TaxID=1302690 RepID=A0A1M5A5A8_9BACT|nr:glycosyltransferase N-terminal domain-containing protein [Cnuella takakiae]OLY92092.1 hypothetical protein BUE76_09430 [Cnuella takakiae]SHF25375.1 3-deoxy-D-manno-octulosonic-acid transferase [Cnuella takakiae]
MLFFYNTFINLYNAALQLAAGRNTKAAAWVKGRQDQFAQIERELAANQSPVVWVHSASTGEFEQAKPVIEALRKAYPHYKVLVTFFSPSGYEATAKYAHVHYRYYLPLDTALNAERFIKLVNPRLVIFSKYDFWHHHIKAVADKGIPLLLISAIFRRGQLFFRGYGGFYRNILRRFTHIFVQDENSVQLLRNIGINQCSVGSDTRFDRVMAVVTERDQLLQKAAVFSRFINDRFCLVAGSTWPADEALLQEAAIRFPDHCFLIVPHELDAAHLQNLSTRFEGAVFYSDWVNRADTTGTIPPGNVMIVNTMGMLAALYSLATVTYVGGGFSKSGIHNTLEAAVWGKPVIIGPNYQKFREAKGLIEAGGAFSVSQSDQLQQLVQHFNNNKAALEAASAGAKNYVVQNAGATGKIMDFIRQLEKQQNSSFRQFNS